MKNLLVLVIFIAGLNTVFAQPTLEDVHWLIGTWHRTHMKPGHSGTEVWHPVSATELTGMGISMQGTDTAFVEKLKIIFRDNTLFYVADVPENKEPVLFRFTELSFNKFVCENPQHDFPKKISYAWDGTTLTATISGDGKKIDFVFVKKE